MRNLSALIMRLRIGAGESAAPSVWVLLLSCALLCAQNAGDIRQQISGVRKLPDDVRARTTKDLALAIRAVPAPAERLNLAAALANYATEGDFGRDTMQ